MAGHTPTDAGQTRVVFAGTPRFAVPALRRLLEDGFDVAAVYTNPDRPTGRGRKLRSGPVKELAERHALSVLQPTALNDDGVVAELRAFDPAVLVVVAYGKILPAPILAVPTFGCINVHASLLPRWRGAAPIARAIEAGDERTGVTIMKMDRGMDTGPVLAMRAVPIGTRDNAETMHEVLARVGAELLSEVLPGVIRGEVRPVEQDHDAATYAPKLSKSEGRIDWRRSAPQISNQVRAFYPWPIAYTFHGAERIRVLDARIVSATAGAPSTGPAGTVRGAAKEGVEVFCGEGVLSLLRLQRDNGKPLPAGEFINGYPLRGGERLR